MKLITKILDNLSKGEYSKFLEATSRAALVGTDQRDDDKYRRLSAGGRDLNPVSFERARKQSLYLWQRNPLCQRMIEIVMDFCLGDDFKIELQVKNKKGNELVLDEKKSAELQERWELFCNDSINQFYHRLEDYLIEIKLTGELLLPVFPNQYNGNVRLGYIDSSLIDKVVMDGSGFLVDKVVYRTPDQVGDEKSLKVIQLNDQSGKYEGEAFFFQQNKLLNQSRGYPDVMNLVDWLDGFDQFLFNALEHAALVGAFFYDCKMIGATEEELKKHASNLMPPKKGSVKLHNEKTEWDVISPELKAMDTAELTRMFKNFILAAKGYPEHWFSDGGNANRATAAEMDTPVMRMLKKEQHKIKSFIEPIALFVAHSANAQMKIFDAKNDVVEVQINMFDFERKDAAVIGTGFVQVVNALTLATGNSWITNDKAKEICDGFLTRLGVAPDFDKTFDEIKQKNKEKDEEDIYDIKNKLPFTRKVEEGEGK